MAVELPASFPSATFPESPMEGDDVVYPCKGCGEILEEGKAFELAGNRWHIDCFRCNTCGTLLDSDANLLLLGDGSLICNNCTYSCNACGNKIEDLAILTGDQAFCASCFRCRNCKRKIENLRYARTSQGIFCMTCHESLMAKRRKHKKQRAANNMNKDKSLPDLPQDMSSMSSMPDNVFELATPANEPTADPIEQTDSDRRSSRRRGESKDFGLRDSTSGAQSGNDTLTLPASTYTATSSASRGKAPMELETTESTGMDDGLFVPFILDPSPAPTVAASPYVDEHTGKVLSPPPEPPSGVVELSARDSVIPRKLPASAIPRVPASSSSRASSPDRATGSPQRTNRQISGNKRGDSLSSPPPQSSGLNNSFADALSGPSSFKLQDVPKHRRGDSSRSLEGSHYNDDASTTGKSTYSTTDDTDFSQTTVTSDATQEKKKLQDHTVSRTGSVLKRGKPSGEQSSTSIPKRGDSLQNSARMQGQDRKDVEQPGRSTSSPAVSKKSTGAVAPQSSFESTAAQSDGKINPLAISTMPRSGDPPSIPPARSSSRPAASPKPALSDAFISPRAAPPPPPQAQAQTTSYPSAPQHKASESTSTMRSELSIQMSPVNLPRYSTGGDFSMQEDLDRILRGEGEQTPPGMLRKMSNAMKGHGRSFSDRGLTSGTSSSKYSTRSPLNGMEISSPTLATSPSGSSRDDLLSDTKHKLQRAERRIAELESEKHRILHSSADFSEVDTKLKEKRTTMAFLETQRELVIRELEVMTDNLKRAKDSNQPLNLKTLKSDVLADLNASVKDLKESLSKEIETLVQKRDSITNEISDLIAMKDKGIQEYESLSNRNTQLTQHNNELIHSIQDFYKANRQPNGSSFDGGRPQLPNGLGIQLGITTPKTDEARMLYGNENSVPSSIQESEQDSMISTPQVVNIRKPKKANMLKKGTAGFLRGARGIFSADDNNRMERDQPLTIGVPYTQQPDGQIPRSGQPPQKYGLFGNEKMQQGPTKLTNLKHSHTNSSNPNLVADAAAGAQSLFGSDLTVRCNLEGRVIPAIVARCIEEVEIRGMDVEGIYRKSGGSGQVNQLKSGFEAIAPTSTETFDISDVDLDIHAVTSTLKQYFRRLPVPLITYDVYDSLLEAVRVEDIEKRVVVMRECLDTLPRCHRDCLEFLVFHLGRVMEKAQFNLMTPLNLAVVFAPTVLRPQSIEREMTDMQTQRNAIQFILENSKSIFADA